jgi:hypothetical protein
MRLYGWLHVLLVLGLSMILGAWSPALATTDHGGRASHEELPAVTYSTRSIY